MVKKKGRRLKAEGRSKTTLNNYYIYPNFEKRDP
jgi:hypothetical protein